METLKGNGTPKARLLSKHHHNTVLQHLILKVILETIYHKIPVLESYQNYTSQIVDQIYTLFLTISSAHNQWCLNRSVPGISHPGSSALIEIQENL